MSTVYVYRLSEEGVLDDLSKLKSRVATLKEIVQTEVEILQQTQSFLEVSILVFDVLSCEQKHWHAVFHQDSWGVNYTLTFSV